MEMGPIISTEMVSALCRDEITGLPTIWDAYLD